MTCCPPPSALSHRRSREGLDVPPDALLGTAAALGSPDDVLGKASRPLFNEPEDTTTRRITLAASDLSSETALGDRALSKVSGISSIGSFKRIRCLMWQPAAPRRATLCRGIRPRDAVLARVAAQPVLYWTCTAPATLQRRVLDSDRRA